MSAKATAKHISMLLITLLIFLSAAAIASAADLKLSTNQSDYYFVVGEQAIVPLGIDNSYGHDINGMLTYTITQQVNQGNFQYSSTNTNSASFTAPDGNNIVQVSFGTSSSPVTLKVSLSFSYTEKEQRQTDLSGLTIHFVQQESDKQENQNKIESSSQKTSEQQQGQQQQGQSIQQQMQNMMNQALGNQEEEQSQNTQQKLQNNQISQDSTALKQQMEKQMQEEEQMKQELQKHIAQNPDFQKAHQQLLNQGYNATNANIDAVSNDTGTFEVDYQKPDGEQAVIKGEMQNGSMTNMNSLSHEDQQKMLEQLKNNKDFQNLDNQLKKQGLSQQNAQFTPEINRTDLRINYTGKNNQTNAINAEFVNGTIKKVELENEATKGKSYLWLWIIIAVVLAFIGYLVYRKYFRKPVISLDEEKPVEKPFDYASEARRMLQESRKMFDKKEYKDAYGRAGQALRLFLSHENDLKKEITNDEMIRHLRKHRKQGVEEIKECFDLCSLVEFAKYAPNKKDFDRIVSIAGKFIGKK